MAHPLAGTWRIALIQDPHQLPNGFPDESLPDGTFELDIDATGNFRSGRHHSTPDVELKQPVAARVPPHAIRLLDESIRRVYSGAVVDLIPGHQIIVGHFERFGADRARKDGELRDGQEEGSWIGVKP